MKKIISVLFCFCAVQLPVFALVEIPNVPICPAGAHWTNQTTDMSRKCVVCPEGKYTDIPDSSVCITCPSGYDHTCDDSTECHNSVQDCYAIVTFHGNGGLSPKGEENETVEVFYPKVEANFTSTPQCYLKEDGMDGTSLCSVQSGDGRPVVYKITDGVGTNETVWKKTGYIFKGWLKNINNKVPVAKNDTFSGDLSLYAKWEHEKVTCAKGYYLPKNESECAECPGTEEGQGFYCKGGDYPILQDEDQGKTACPYGFSLAQEGAQNEASCYTLFKFYPGNGSSFSGRTYNSDDLYIQKGMFYGKNSVLFGYDNGKRWLASKFLAGGSSQPTNPDKVFSHWELQNGNNRIRITENMDISIYVNNGTNRNIYAVWCGENRILQNGECVCKKGYYKDNGTCAKCGDGLTTITDGANSSDQCQKVILFQYDIDKTWTWPDAVKVGEIKNVKPK